jgi:hypothetical protein
MTKCVALVSYDVRDGGEDYTQVSALIVTLCVLDHAGEIRHVSRPVPRPSHDGARGPAADRGSSSQRARGAATGTWQWTRHRTLKRARSLLFVAATRARDALAITWHGTPGPFLPR